MRYSVVPSAPPVSDASARIGAAIRTRVKSNGLAISPTERTGRSRAAVASSAMIPPRHQPTSWMSLRPESRTTASIAFGITSSTQCSRPSARSLNEIAP
jgi:hypothetical protein